MKKPTVHLMTQDDQPYGSERRCCEKCGRAYWNWPEVDRYVTERRHFTQEVAGKEYALCGDETNT